MDSDTLDVIFDQAHGNCRRRSSSPFRDYADRYLGSPRFLRMHYLLACRVKFPVEQGLEHKASLADFSGFICEVEHPSEAELRILN